MILIRKGPPPNALTTYRLQPDTSASPPRPAYYDGPSFGEVKGAVRDALLAEQRGVCCYCTDRITERSTKIEHRVPQHGPDGDSSRSLDWPNLLAACCGEIDNPVGEGARLLHCDSSKGDLPIALDPTNPAHVDSLSYRRDGTLLSGQPGHQREIEEVLRLNLPELRRRRLKALTAVQRELGQRHSARALPRAGLEKLLDGYRHPQGQHRPFAGFLCWWVDRALRKAV